MILVDDVAGWDQGIVRAGITIRVDSPFYERDMGVPAYAGLEYMAQTCGLYAGIEAHNHGQPVRLGFLLGTRNFHATRDWFREGERLLVEASEIFREDRMAVFSCVIRCNDEEIASAQLNLYQPEESSPENG